MYSIIKKTRSTTEHYGTVQGLQRVFDDHLRGITYIGSNVEATVRCLIVPARKVVVGGKIKQRSVVPTVCVCVIF